MPAAPLTHPPEERRIRVDIRHQTCAPHPDALVEKTAERQHGVVARWQLLDAGMTLAMLRTRTTNRSLLSLHPGVYAVGHRQLRREGHWLAAVLAVGPGAVLSHRDAAGLHGLRPANHPITDVTTMRRGRGSRPRIAVHHATLDPDDVTTVDGIPVTTVARTLVDLAAVVPADQLMRAVTEAERQRTFDLNAIDAALTRVRGRHGPGQAKLKTVLAEMRQRGIQLTRSVLEERFLALVAAHGLPCPQTNAHIDGFEVDAVWHGDRVAVELDGYAHHHDRQTFQRDREKGNALTEAGWTLLRFTHDDVVRRPGETASRLWRSLHRRAAA